MTIGGNRGKAIKAGGAGGNFSRDDIAWLAQNGTLYGDPGVGFAPPGSSGTPDGHTATGGVINDWVDPAPGAVYRTHTFTTSGTFAITALSPTYPAHVDFLVVGGGGGGGGTRENYMGSGGGGAGGLRTNIPGVATPPGSRNPAVSLSMPSTIFPVSAGPTSYPVTVGAGGLGSMWVNGANNRIVNGSPSVLTHPNSPETVTSAGGGGGSIGSPDPDGALKDGGSGGSGGGGSYSTGGGYGSGNSPSTSPVQGYPGGGSSPSNSDKSAAAGGGGAGGQGYDGIAPPSPVGVKGGEGVQVKINPAGGTPGPDPAGQYYAGGGGGGGYFNPSAGNYPGGNQYGGGGGTNPAGGSNNLRGESGTAGSGGGGGDGSGGGNVTCI